MAKKSIIPFGPQHPVLPEPIHLDLVLEDEKVVEAIPSIGFVHRGLESLVDKKDFNEMTYESGEHKVKVQPVFEGNSVNLAKTTKENELKFKKLNAPTISLTSTSVQWDNGVDFASYEVVLKFNGNEILNIKCRRK